MGPSTPTVPGFITVNQAAELLGVKPWDVRRMADNGELAAVVLIDQTSIDHLKERA